MGYSARILLIAVLSTVAALSQKLFIETDTPEGQLLQQIDADQNAAHKLALLEQFAKQFPNHEAVNWVLSHLQSAYLEKKQYERVLELGTRLLGLDSDDVAAAHNCLKAAEAKKNVDMIRKWSAQTSQVARRVMQLKRPDDEEEVADWKAKAEYARQVEQYSEYALYYAAVQSEDTRVKSSLIEALEQRNPMSEYLAQMRTAHTQVVRQVDIEEAVAAAEASFAKGLYHEDQLMMVASYYMQKRKETDKIIAYSNKIVEILSNKPKPDEYATEGDWTKRKNSMLGAASWMAGLLYSVREQFGLADRALRVALPLLTSGDMRAGALYHLGYVNFRLAEAGDRIRIHEAVRFTTECISIDSAVKAQAIENLKSMKAEYNLQ